MIYPQQSEELAISIYKFYSDVEQNHGGAEAFYAYF